MYFSRTASVLFLLRNNTDCVRLKAYAYQYMIVSVRKEATRPRCVVLSSFPLNHDQPLSLAELRENSKLSYDAEVLSFKILSGRTMGAGTAYKSLVLLSLNSFFTTILNFAPNKITLSSISCASLLSLAVISKYQFRGPWFARALVLVLTTQDRNHRDDVPAHSLSPRCTSSVSKKQIRCANALSSPRPRDV